MQDDLYELQLKCSGKQASGNIPFLVFSWTGQSYKELLTKVDILFCVPVISPHSCLKSMDIYPLGDSMSDICLYAYPGLDWNL